MAVSGEVPAVAPVAAALAVMADVDMVQNKIVELLMMTVESYLVAVAPAAVPADRMAAVAALENQVAKAV